MNEMPPSQKSPEEQEYDEYIAAHFKLHPDPVLPIESRRACGLEVTECEEMLRSYEVAHDLVALHAIIDLTFEESRVHPVREPARQALIPIDKKLKDLQNETDISTEQLGELRAKYKVLSQAVGLIVNDSKIDHTR